MVVGAATRSPSSPEQAAATHTTITTTAARTNRLGSRAPSESPGLRPETDSSASLFATTPVLPGCLATCVTPGDLPETHRWPDCTEARGPRPVTGLGPFLCPQVNDAPAVGDVGNHALPPGSRGHTVEWAVLDLERRRPTARRSGPRAPIIRSRWALPPSSRQRGSGPSVDGPPTRVARRSLCTAFQEPRSNELLVAATESVRLEGRRPPSLRESERVA